MKQRLAPFLALLDAKYAPLLFAVAPQAYNVYLWLFPKPYDGWGELFAIMGAIGYEAVYVGAIAWAEEGKSSFWTWATATLALIFSIGVAVFVNLDEGWWASLHAGFPIVAYTYTINMYVATHRKPAKDVQAIITVDHVQPTGNPQLALAPALPMVQATEVVAATVQAPESKPRKPVQASKLQGVDVAAELASKFAGNRKAMADHYGVSRQAIDNRMKGVA